MSSGGFDTTPRTGGGGAGLCVLLVEDNEADAYLIGRVLAANSTIGTIVHAWDGIEALAKVDSGEVAPDLALIDLHMPRMNGFDLLVAFNTLAKADFPMLVLTSSSAPADAVRGRLRKAIQVVIKPETIADMQAVLKTAIEAACASRLTSSSRPDAPAPSPDPAPEGAPGAPGAGRTLAALSRSRAPSLLGERS